jgi:HAD superfamily hydrolase (TIGR01509 family)
MQVLFLGSIGTLADTTELLREACNAAFAEAGLDWYWDRPAHRRMLALPGLRERIARYAAAGGEEVPLDRLLRLARARFRERLDWGHARMRPGLMELLDAAERRGVPVALVTTSDPRDVDHLLAGIGLDRTDFAIVTDAEDVVAPKPAPDCYHLACARLAVAPERCVAIEDHPAGVRAARDAGASVLAWPGPDARGLDYGSARVIGEDALPGAALDALAGARATVG